MREIEIERGKRENDGGKREEGGMRGKNEKRERNNVGLKGEEWRK